MYLEALGILKKARNGFDRTILSDTDRCPFCGNTGREHVEYGKRVCPPIGPKMEQIPRIGRGATRNVWSF